MGQVTCSECWYEADRKTVAYGAEADVKCAIRCANGGVDGALARIAVTSPHPITIRSQRGEASVITFEVKQKRLLQVGLQGEKIMARAGAMVAYDGSIKFEKAILGGEGFFGALKRKVTNEGMSLMVSSGTGTIYFAHEAREIAVIPLQGEKIFIESSSLLAFDQSLRTSTAFAGLRGATTGQGLFTTTVEGHGNIAVVSDGGIIMLEVGGQYPLFVDPDAFIAHKGNISQEFIFDVNWKTMIGQSSGESFQLKFTGSGIVYIQASELK